METLHSVSFYRLFGAILINLLIFTALGLWLKKKSKRGMIDAAAGTTARPAPGRSVTPGV